MTSLLLIKLMEALRCLPGVGPKSSQRMALHLLEHDREGAKKLISTLEAALSNIVHCRLCRNFSETEICSFCNDPNRNTTIICVTETSADAMAIERATGFRGLYFVLMGHLSPLDGIGPVELGLDELEIRLNNKELRELIIATNPTVEGEATAYYIAALASKCGIFTTRIAHGVPLGGELEQVDYGTLAHAFEGRRTF